MDSQVHLVDIGQFALIGGFIWTLVQLWTANKKRDKELSAKAAQEAVWKERVNIKMDTYEKDRITAQAILTSIDSLRKDVREDHRSMREYVHDEIRRLEDKASERTRNLHAKIDEITTNR